MKAAQPEVLAAPRSNPGETLRKARESRGWSVAEVASQLNLTVQRVSQIEAGAFDKLPGHTFARGYVRTYAKLLGVDPNRLVLEFDQYTNSDAGGCSVHSLGHIEEPRSYSQRVLRLVSFVLLLGLAGAGFYWWQEQGAGRDEQGLAASFEQVEVESVDGTTLIHPLDEPEDQAVLLVQGEAQLQLPLASEMSAGEGTAEIPAAASTEVQADAVEDAAPEPEATVQVPAATESAETAAVTEPVATEAVVVSAPLAAGQARVNINFTADCWTQLTDADGKVLFSALKRKGDNLELVGKPPFELRLGFARGAEVSYNGSAVDVMPFVSGETARMKLGQ